MFIVGLTGGIATGKSTVSRIFKDLGCPVVDADEIAREVVKPYQPAWKALVQNFGRHILLPNEEIDREKLGKIVFGDDAKRRVLNKCTHPAVYSSIWWALLKYFVKGEKFVILDLPLLYESGVSLFLLKDVIVVYCDRDTQLQRLMERNNFTQSDAELRINAQMSLDEKCKRSSYIINNSSNRETTEKQAKRLYETFTRSFAYLPLRVFVLFVLLLIAWLLICLMRLVSW